MLVIALLLAVVAVGLGFYAQANNSQQDYTIFGTTWHTYTWVPAAVAAAAVALICIGTLMWAMWRVRALKRANAMLRNDINLYKLERATPAAAPRATAGEPEREYVGRDTSRPVGAAASAPPPADQARERADQAREPADQARERKDAEHLQAFPAEARPAR